MGSEIKGCVVAPDVKQNDSRRAGTGVTIG